jgi:tetratricopeptide (TPR) repeat protein
MKTKHIIYLLLFFTNNLVFGQELICEKMPVNELELCSVRELETDACVTIIADKSLQLGFRSSNEILEDFFDGKEEFGTQIHYYMHFKTDIDHNMDRTLEIFTKTNPNPLELDLSYLLPNKLKMYSIKSISCYSLLFREGNTLFSSGQYQSAKEKYLTAQTCYDAPLDGDIEKKIMQIDTILVWIKIADENMLLLDYTKAEIYYGKVYAENDKDKNIIDKLDKAVKKKEEFCKKYFDKAKLYSKEHEYEKALELYERLVKQNCSNQQYNLHQIDTIQKKISKQKNRNRVLTLEYAVNKLSKHDLSLLSFSIGGYYDKKVGGYFSFATNPAFFNMLRSDYTKAVQADAGISFGGNFRPLADIPLWIHFGIGYTFMGAYTYKNELDEVVRYEGGELPDADLKLVNYHAFHLETGLLIKIKWFALRYTFQYRHALKLETKDYICPFMHSFGIGLCW